MAPILLTWTYTGSSTDSYTAWTPVGNFDLEDYGTMVLCYFNDRRIKIVKGKYSLEDAKIFCQKYFEDLISECLQVYQDPN